MQNSGLMPIIMAKYPEPGRVKTRLVGGRVSPEIAARVAEACLRCITGRVRRIFGTVGLAVAPDDMCRALADRLGGAFESVCGQGAGTLGDRLGRTWRGLAEDQPVAFFGMDSPDIPVEHLRSLVSTLAEHDVAIGPTPDGGYWTLAARRHHPQVLHQIDWGSALVYDQTKQRTRAAGLVAAELPCWFDVDDWADLEALWQRLGGRGSQEPELQTLSEELWATGLFSDPWKTTA